VRDKNVFKNRLFYSIENGGTKKEIVEVVVVI
jgi:hypothetical protein